MIERPAVCQVDVADPAIELGQDGASLGRDNCEIGVRASKCNDRCHRFPACDDDDLDITIVLDLLKRRAQEAVGALELRPDGAFEVRDVRLGRLWPFGPACPSSRDHSNSLPRCVRRPGGQRARFGGGARRAARDSFGDVDARGRCSGY